LDETFGLVDLSFDDNKCLLNRKYSYTHHLYLRDHTIHGDIKEKEYQQKHIHYLSVVFRDNKRKTKLNEYVIW
jgi:hypothetical protein